MDRNPTSCVFLQQRIPHDRLFPPYWDLTNQSIILSRVIPGNNRDSYPIRFFSTKRGRSVYRILRFCNIMYPLNFYKCYVPVSLHTLRDLNADRSFLLSSEYPNSEIGHNRRYSGPQIIHSLNLS